ncbi:hypothetical protein PR048_033294 [Dryococelus australis]|uniref:Uncharacterized protein n=1 Tax=Dryococelus australis TaxID=614101 RepID=A0ABQ9G154_9NEOP|nr:hypothetical protein PR048_033294 [Dryococelus australis]
MLSEISVNLIGPPSCFDTCCHSGIQGVRIAWAKFAFYTCSMNFEVHEDSRMLDERPICQLAGSLVCHLREPGSIHAAVALRFSHVRILPDDAAGQRVVSEISRFPRHCIPALLHTHLASPSSALKTSMLRPPKSLHFTHLCSIRDIWFHFNIKEVIDDGMATAYLLHVYRVKPMTCLSSFNCACADRLFTFSHCEKKKRNFDPYTRPELSQGLAFGDCVVNQSQPPPYKFRPNITSLPARPGMLYTATMCTACRNNICGGGRRRCINCHSKVQRTPGNVGPANIRTFLGNYNKLQADSASSAQREPIIMHYVDPHTWRGAKSVLGREEGHRGEGSLPTELLQPHYRVLYPLSYCSLTIGCSTHRATAAPLLGSLPTGLLQPHYKVLYPLSYCGPTIRFSTH